jgi:histidinol phosphatase-like PHP family hydrolase
MKGYQAMAITDHVDASNVDFVVTRLARICDRLSATWKIDVIPGCEITHIPTQHFKKLVKNARANGARLVVVHGETIVEPVVPGTNMKALECDIDILAHPGLIKLEEAKLAKKKGICLEITSRKGHCLTNGHVAKTARQAGAKLVIGTDAHRPEDLITREMAVKVATGAGLSRKEIDACFRNAQALISRARRA